MSEPHDPNAPAPDRDMPFQGAQLDALLTKGASRANQHLQAAKLLDRATRSAGKYRRAAWRVGVMAPLAIATAYFLDSWLVQPLAWSLPLIPIYAVLDYRCRRATRSTALVAGGLFDGWRAELRGRIRGVRWVSGLAAGSAVAWWLFAPTSIGTPMAAVLGAWAAYLWLVHRSQLMRELVLCQNA